DIATFVRDVAVGPGSAGRWRPVEPLGATPRVRSGADELPLQILDRTLRHDRIEAPRHYPDDDIVESASAVLWVPPIAGFEVVAFPIVSDASSALADGPAHPARTGDRSLTNGLVAVTVDGRGQVAVDAGSARIESLVGFEDVGDAGDLYTHSTVGAP